MQEIRINKNDSGQRVDKFIKRYLPNATTSFIYKMIRKKNITLNSKKLLGNEILLENDCIQFYFSEETFKKFHNANKEESHDSIQEYKEAYNTLIGIEIIYENEEILLLNKPSGILTQKSSASDLSLNEWLIGYLLHQNKITKESLSMFKPSVCNRLDRNTSGIVICGKTLYGTQCMSDLIKSRKIKKYYRLFVVGQLKGTGTLTGYLSKNTDTNTVKIYDAILSNDNANNYAKIMTKYNSLYSNTKYTYLEVELITGKTHQIRAHFSKIGHPILGDYKYGDTSINKQILPLGIKDQMLHAYRLVFPEMDERLSDLSLKEFACKEPETFLKIKENL